MPLLQDVALMVDNEKVQEQFQLELVEVDDGAASFVEGMDGNKDMAGAYLP